MPKISKYAAVTVPDDADILVVVQGGVTKKVTLGTLKALYTPYTKNNFSGTTAPGAGDDSADGYSVGSVWVNVAGTPKEAYQCMDATAGAAVWINTTLDISELGTGAIRAIEAATAENDVLVGAAASPWGWVKKTLAEFRALLFGADISVGTTAAGRNLTVNATRTSIFTHDAANYLEDGATWTIAGTGPLAHVAGNTTALTAATTEAIVAGAAYRVTITGTGGGGVANYTLGGVSGTEIAASGAIAIEDYIVASTTGAFIITPASACTVSITSITIEKLTDTTGDITAHGNIISKRQILLPLSSAAYPSLSWRTDRYTGFFWSGAGVIAISSQGIQRYSFFADRLDVIHPSGSYSISGDVFWCRDAINISGFRNATAQQIIRLYNTYTNASNFERLALTGVQGASVNLTAETAGTGAANLDIVLTPAGTGVISLPAARTKNATAATGGLVRKSASASAAITASASIEIPVAVPAGARLVGVQLRTDAGLAAGELWDAAFSGGSTAAICSGQAVAKNTKVNSLTTDVTTATTNIAVTRNGGGNFTAQGTIRAIVYYEAFDAMADAA